MGRTKALGAVEYEALALLDRLTARRQTPGEALNDESGGAGRVCEGDQLARSFGVELGLHGADHRQAARRGAAVALDAA